MVKHCRRWSINSKTICSRHTTLFSAVGAILLAALTSTTSFAQTAADDDSQIGPSRTAHVMARHSVMVKATEDPNSYAVIVRKLLVLSESGPRSLKIPEADRAKLLAARTSTNNSEIHKIFKPIAAQIQATLNEEPVDVYRVGSLIMQAETAELAYKARVYREAVASMSPRGQAVLRKAIEEEAKSLRYAAVDFATAGYDDPELIVQIAERFIASIEEVDRRGGISPDAKDLSTEQWGVILK